MVPEECTICLEPMYPDQQITILACMHSFHRACCQSVVESKEDKDAPSFANLCVLCRAWNGFVHPERVIVKWWHQATPDICVGVLGWCFQVELSIYVLCTVIIVLQAEEAERNGCDTDNRPQEITFVKARIQGCHDRGEWQTVQLYLEAAVSLRGNGGQCALFSQLWNTAISLLFCETKPKYLKFIEKHMRRVMGISFSNFRKFPVCDV